MKRFQLLLTACLLLMATTASAQFSNTGSSGSKSKSGSVLSMNTDPYTRVFVGYSPLKLTAKASTPHGDTEEDMNFKGITAGLVHGISLSDRLPFFVELGANLQYSAHKDEESDDYPDEYYRWTEETKYWFLSMNIPVNLSYKFSLADDKFGITPFVGLNFRVNFTGENYVKGKEASYSYSHCANLFDDSKDEMDIAAWNHFQMGLNVGLNLNYQNLSLGVQYTTDFMPIYKFDDGHNYEYKGNVGVTTISLGVLF